MRNLRIYIGLAAMLFMSYQRSSMAQSGICKTDHWAFVAANPSIEDEYSAKDFKDQFDKIAGSLSHVLATITLSKLNAGATADEISDYLGCVTDNDRYVTVGKRGQGGQENDLTNAPAAFISQAVDPPQAVVASYSVIGHANDQNYAIAPSRPIVQCFVKKDTQWSFVGELGGDYAGFTFSIYLLNSPVPGEVWTLLAGRTIGDTGGRLRLEIVTCDGKTFTKKWSRDGLRWGEVSATGSTVLLTYEKLDEKGRVIFSPSGPDRYSEVLHVTPNGLE